MAQTIRDLIKEKASILSDMDAVGTEKASQELVELSSLLASIGKECVDRKAWYAIRKMELLKEHGSAAKATIYAEASSEYKDWLEAEEYRKAVIEMMRAIKYFLRNSETELKESKY